MAPIAVLREGLRLAAFGRGVAKPTEDLASAIMTAASAILIRLPRSVGQ